jgi:glycosyltransferase 2 family protein
MNGSRWLQNALHRVPAIATEPLNFRTFLKALIKWTLFLLVIYFVGRALWQQFEQIEWATVQFRAWPVAAAVVCMLGVSSVQMISYRMLLAAYAHAPSWLNMAAVAWVPPLGKYVPGKIASIAGAVYLLRRLDVPPAVALSVVLVLDGLAVVAGLITGAPLLMWEPVRQYLPSAWMWCIAMIVGGIIVLHPRVFGTLVNVALRRLKRPPLERLPSLRCYIVPVICAFTQWLFAGMALWFMTRAITDEVPITRLPLFVSIAALAMTISYLALFAPGGLGVREEIYRRTLTIILGPQSALIVVAMRLAQTLVEILVASIGLLVLRSMKRRVPGEAAVLHEARQS